MRKPTIRKARAAVASVLLVGLSAVAIVTSGCGGSSAISISPEAVAKAADTTTAAKSFRLTLNGTFSTPASGPLTLSGSGAVDVSKRVADLTFQIPKLPAGQGASTGPVSFHEVFAGNAIYVAPSGRPAGASLPGGKKWIKVDLGALLAGKGINLNQLGGGLGGSDPSQYLSYLRGAGQVKKLGTESINGVSTTHYHAVIDLKTALNRLSNGSPTAQAGLKSLLNQVGNAKIPTDVWIDGQGLVRQERVSYSFPSGAAAGTKVSFTIDFSDFGTPVSVTTPPASEVFDVTSAAATGLNQSSTHQGTATTPRHARKRRSPSPLY